MKYSISKDGVVISVEFAPGECISKCTRPRISEEQWEDHLNDLECLLVSSMARLRELYMKRRYDIEAFEEARDKILELEDRIEEWKRTPYAV